MTLDELVDSGRGRPPTGGEIFEAVTCLGWRVDPRTQMLRGPAKTDPLYLTVRALLGREPWRGEFLAAAAAARTEPEPGTATEEPPHPGEPDPTPAPTHCQQCRAWVNPEADRADVRAMCGQGRCPYGSPPKRW
jgi:hypothetical protein